MSFKTYIEEQEDLATKTHLITMQGDGDPIREAVGMIITALHLSQADLAKALKEELSKKTETVSKIDTLIKTCLAALLLPYLAILIYWLFLG